jgi:hypothetical protein
MSRAFGGKMSLAQLSEFYIYRIIYSDSGLATKIVHI